MFSRVMRNLPLVGNRLPSLSMLRATDQWRHLYPWFQSRRENYLLDHAIPWLVYDAAEYLRANLQKNIRVFEYGSGSSTLFWSKFDAHCTSIEHDGSWVSVLRTRFNPAYDVDLRLVPTDNPPLPLDKDIADPSGYRSDWFGFERQTFKTYVEQIDTFPDGCFDVVLVDGQARPSCIAHSYKKVKSGECSLSIIPNCRTIRPHSMSISRLSNVTALPESPPSKGYSRARTCISPPKIFEGVLI